MSEEWFDVVDEHDRVVGTAPRRAVHAGGMRHRAIHALVFNARADLFLQRRSPTKDLHPNVWDSSCSGHCDRGEDYAVTVLRELREELGFATAADQVRELARLPACEATGQEFIRVYLLNAEGPFELHPDEISDGRWWTRAELMETLARDPDEFSPALIHVLAHVDAQLPWHPRGMGILPMSPPP
jgi:isopentenyl-diphosphate delta-isomerase type 1